MALDRGARHARSRKQGRSQQLGLGGKIMKRDELTEPLRGAEIELRNEISNLQHDYAIVSAERNNLRAHAERLAEALKIVANSGWLVELPEKSQAIVREALAQWEAGQ
jgi:hypothetical protein